MLKPRNALITGAQKHKLTMPKLINAKTDAQLTKNGMLKPRNVLIDALKLKSLIQKLMNATKQNVLKVKFWLKVNVLLISELKFQWATIGERTEKLKIWNL